MDINKSNLFISGDDMSIGFTFTKVDKQNRRITGIATANNIDSEDDLIDFEASKKAFTTWVGNIREMHAPKAVGKAVSAKEITVVDENTGEEYQGVEVVAYISKGANDTWEKILDGTLKGFSVGGRILQKSKEFHKSAGKFVTRIKDYVLTELSVVDNPANPLAQFTMIKSAGDGTLSLVEEAEISMELVFYCEKDGIAKINEQTCYVCNEEMVEIGYVESVEANEIAKMIEDYELSKAVTNAHKTPPKGKPEDRGMYADPVNFKYPLDTPERVMSAMSYFNHDGQREAGGYSESQWAAIGAKIAAAVSKQTGMHHVYSNGKVVQSHMNKTDGGTDLLNNNNDGTINDMELSPKQRESLIGKFASLLFGSSTAEVIEKSDEAVASTVEDAGGGADEVTEEVIKKSEAADEVVEVSEEEVIEKTENTTEVADEVTEEVIEKAADEGENMEFSLDDIKAALADAVAPVAARVEEVAKSVETLGEEVENVKKGGAIKKSVDADEVTEEEVVDEPLKKNSESFWGNVFVPQVVIEALGYES